MTIRTNPATRFSSETFQLSPHGIAAANDPAIATAAPSPGTPEYGAKVARYLQTTVPEVWDGQRVDFWQSYLSVAPSDAGTLSPLRALEVRGFPPSQPARDPNSANFIYQRFQRGIL